MCSGGRLVNPVGLDPVGAPPGRAQGHKPSLPFLPGPRPVLRAAFCPPLLGGRRGGGGLLVAEGVSPSGRTGIAGSDHHMFSLLCPDTSSFTPSSL